MRPFLLILGVFFSITHLSLKAQDVEIQYLKIQENYSSRVDDILQRYKKSQRELINKFILALVRLEQGYREEGDLDGVVFCRDLRENLLVNAMFPLNTEEVPEAMRDILTLLEEKRQENEQIHQQELDHLNVMLYRALEAYQREFTRQSMLDKAEEIFKIRDLIAGSTEAARSEAKSQEILPTSFSTDPNQYPFAFEGDAYGERRGVIPRSCSIDLSPTLTDQVEKEPLGYRFVNGQVTFPANETGPFIQDLVRNRMFSMEIAFQPDFDFQGFPHNPVVLFQLGETPETALLSMTLEGRKIVLYFQTDIPPSNRKNHRIVIGNLQANEPTHICITYRTGDFFIYRNGVATHQLRNEIKGTLDKWEPVPVIIGKSPPQPGIEFILPYRGVLNHVYLKAGDLSSRQVVSNYNRYMLLFE